MTRQLRAVAHVVTNEAHGLGDPGIIVMTVAECAGNGGRLVAQYGLSRVSMPHALIDLWNRGWSPGTEQLIEPGYYAVPVTRDLPEAQGATS